MRETNEHLDSEFMRRAIALAERGTGQVSPNPAVGAVLVRDSQVVGEGFFLYEHLKHAEVYALEQAGHLAHGATLYCSLEPCCFLGRTPPCTDALIEGRISRAVIAVEDPHPRVRGRGIQQLREAGITVEVGLLALESQRVNEAFFKFAMAGRPFVHAIREVDVADNPTPQQWRPSARLLRTAETYDAIAIESPTPGSVAVLEALVARPRHRPMIVVGPPDTLGRFRASLGAFDDPEKVLAVVVPAGDTEQPGSTEQSLAQLAQLRALSLLTFPATATSTLLPNVADRVTYVMRTETLRDSPPINGEISRTATSESGDFVEITLGPHQALEIKD